MADSILFEELVEIPLGLRSLDDFRHWAHSEKFPEEGRVDYVGGRIEVDMSPEDVITHGVLKSELVISLGTRIKRGGLGILVTDSTRVSCPEVNLSVEPDIVFLSKARLADGRAKLVPKSSGEPGRFIEVEGPPDLLVEIVSDSSVAKDTKRLPALYYAAGVEEYWLADARGSELLFRIHTRGSSSFEAVESDVDGFQSSGVMGCAFRLSREEGDHGLWTFDLGTKE